MAWAMEAISNLGMVVVLEVGVALGAAASVEEEVVVCELRQALEVLDVDEVCARSCLGTNTADLNYTLFHSYVTTTTSINPTLLFSQTTHYKVSHDSWRCCAKSNYIQHASIIRIS
eukprot:m.50623 g.50623  ORF g.50623 m.50623 type:complete len:116 (+) comp13442_c0_seq1:892-1239(+)